MNFLDYCKANKITENKAKELNEKNDPHYKKAYETFLRPAYYGTVAEQKGEPE